MGAGGDGDAAVKRFTAGDSGRSGAVAGFDFCRAGADQRVAVADSDDRRGQPEEDSARAHGEYQPADHAGRDAGGFCARGSVKPESGRDGAEGFEGTGDDSGRNRPDRGFESELQVAEDEWDYFSGEVGEFARWGNFYDARRGQWDVRDRWRSGRLFVREVWRFERESADREGKRKPPDRGALRKSRTGRRFLEVHTHRREQRPRGRIC